MCEFVGLGTEIERLGTNYICFGTMNLYIFVSYIKFVHVFKVVSQSMSVRRQHLVRNGKH